MTTSEHTGQARQFVIKALTDILDRDERIEKAVIVHDLFGCFRVILWRSAVAEQTEVRERVSSALAGAGAFWTGDVWFSAADTPRPKKLIYDTAWNEGIIVPDQEKLRIDDRTRTRTGWLPRFREPPWTARAGWSKVASPKEMSAEGPPIVVFYSFKGGVGRTTALAAFAIQRTRLGERVLVMDLDLDAPGAGTLLAGDDGDAPLGVVDYLLEAPLGDVDLRNFTHACRREVLVGDAGGEMLVMPAGRVDDGYIAKLSRLDMEIHGEEHPLGQLLAQAREALRPDWILLDARAGLSSSAGVLLDGIAHMHVLFGTNSVQSQLGLTQVIRHLGEERILRDASQARCLIVHAMVVDNVEVEDAARVQFKGWLEKTLRDHYLVAEGEDPEDELWSVRDVNDAESPAHAVAIPYHSRLAFFSLVDKVAVNLVVGPYAELASRLASFLAPDVGVEEGSSE